MSVDASGLQRGLTELAVRAHGKLLAGVVSGAQGRCSRRSGRLADSIEASDSADEGTRVSGTVIVGEDYGNYQDKGTGIYGPEGGRIYPTNGKVLAFDWPAAGGMVFFASVAGSPGTYFWTDTVGDWASIVGSV